MFAIVAAKVENQERDKMIFVVDGETETEKWV